MSHVEFATAVSRAVQLCNRVLGEHGKLEYSISGFRVETRFLSNTGFTCTIEDAPEAVRNLYVLMLPVIVTLEATPCTILLMDHVEEHVTPPLTESYMRTLIDLVLREKEGRPLLVMSVHNLDAFILAVSSALNVLESLNKDPADYLAIYKFKLAGDHVIAERLPTTKLGVKLPEYLVKYAKIIVDLTRAPKGESSQEGS